MYNYFKTKASSTHLKVENDTVSFSKVMFIRCQFQVEWFDLELANYLHGAVLEISRELSNQS